MKIWIINHYAAPLTMPGGTRHYNFARQLIQRGHEVTLIASSFNHISHTYIDSPVSVGNVDFSHDVPFIWIPTSEYSGNTLARFNNMLMFGFKLLRKKSFPRNYYPDVIVASSPHLFAALGGMILSKKLNVPFVLEVRDLWPESLVELGRISTKNPFIFLMSKIESYLYKNADAIISLLPGANEYLIKKGANPNSITWLPNAIDSDHSSPYINACKNAKFTLMYAGAHGVANDLETVLYAASILQKSAETRRIKICLIGEGPEKNRLKDLASTLSLSNIEFLEAVPKKNIYSILERADAYLMLLKDSPVFRWGISPNKLFDYLLMGRPVIFGVNTPFNPIKECNAGIAIPPSDPQALANAILSLSQKSVSELNEMGGRGKNFVLHNHHIQGLTDKLENTLQCIVASFKTHSSCLT